MRRIEGGGQTPGGDRRTRGFGRGARAENSRCLEASQHPRSCRRCGSGLAIGPEALGRLRQRHQQRRLAVAELVGLLAEVEARGRADAREIAAIGGECQIHGEDLILAEARLELEGPRHLDQLGAQGPGPRLQQAGGLHGESGGARDHMAMEHELSHGPQQGQGIHTPMALEALVLIGEQHAPVARIHLPHRHRQSPAAILGREGPQQPAVLVLDQHREIAQAREIRGKQPVEQDRARRQQQQGAGRGREPAADALHRPSHVMGSAASRAPSPYSLCR
jgi:hypothetical protein